MKYYIAIAILALSANAYAYDPALAGATALQQNEQNDPSIHGRRTQTAFELGGVGQEEYRGPVIETAPVDTYPEHIGDAVVDEGYPAKAE